MRTWRRRWQQEMKVGRQNCPDSGKHRSCPKVTRPTSQMNQSLLPDPIFDGRLLEIARQELIVGFVGFSISVGSEFDLLLIPAIFVIPRRRAFIFILRILLHRARCSNRSTPIPCRYRARSVNHALLNPELRSISILIFIAPRDASIGTHSLLKYSIRIISFCVVCTMIPNKVVGIFKGNESAKNIFPVFLDAVDEAFFHDNVNIRQPGRFVPLEFKVGAFCIGLRTSFPSSFGDNPCWV